MRIEKAVSGLVTLAIGFGLGVGTPSARAQGPGGPVSLGGFGASMGDAMPGTGGGPMIIPYGGMFEGFMPGRMGGGSGLSFRTRPGTPAAAKVRGSFRLSPLSGGMSSRFSGGAGLGRMGTIGTRGSTGPRGGMRRLPAGGGGVMPPNFGYPFRQPPSLVSPSAGGTGMSM